MTAQLSSGHQKANKERARNMDFSQKETLREQSHGGTHIWVLLDQSVGGAHLFKPVSGKKVEGKDNLDILIQVSLIFIVRKQSRCHWRSQNNSKCKMHRVTDQEACIWYFKQSQLCIKEMLTKRYNLTQAFCLISISAAAIKHPSQKEALGGKAYLAYNSNYSN